VRIEQNSAALQEYSPFGMAVVLVVLVGLAGRAAAVFLVLFGIGIMLQAKRARLKAASNWPIPQIRRYGLLIVGGLAFVPLWEADILHYIGVFGLLSLIAVRLNTRWLIIGGIAVLVLAELLRVRFDYANGWAIGAVGAGYQDMWSLGGQFRQIFFNGYHPVFPWLAFVIYGISIGRLDLRNTTTLRRLIIGGLSASVVGFSAQALGVEADFFPAHTLFILLGMANATWVIAVCLSVCNTDQPSRLRGIIQDMGRLALTHYPGHVILGIVPLVVVTQERMDMSFESSFACSVIYLVVTAILGQLWLRRHAQGPLEWVLRVMADRPRSKS
jgi:uncharacterized membrane protein YeiB